MSLKAKVVKVRGIELPFPKKNGLFETVGQLFDRFSFINIKHKIHKEILEWKRAALECRSYSHSSESGIKFGTHI